MPVYGPNYLQLCLGECKVISAQESTCGPSPEIVPASFLANEAESIINRLHSRYSEFGGRL